MATPKLTNTILEAAISGFEAQKKAIDVQIAELRAMLTGIPQALSTEEVPSSKKKRILSPAAIKRMKEGQRRRWAKVRGESRQPEVTAAIGSSKPKRKLSAAGRKAIVAALKKRWAAKRAAAA